LKLFQKSKHSILSVVSFFALGFIVTFCGGDQGKSKQNPPALPPAVAQEPLAPPADWDGLADWEQSEWLVVDE
jgi:hypothetical protein